MRKSKFTESQIAATLKQIEAGRRVKDVCRELGISDATYYVWKSKYGGMEASDVQRLRDVEAEHAKAQADVRRTGDGESCIEGSDCNKAVESAHKRLLFACLQDRHGWIGRRACAAISMPWAPICCRYRTDQDEEVIASLVELSERLLDRSAQYFGDR
jgi:putative transposase